MILALGAAGTLWLGACRGETPARDDSTSLLTYVSILPQAGVVRRIGGRHVRVEVLVGPGQSHHSYEPTPRQIAGLAEARVYFRIGVPLERALADRIAASFKNLRVVDTTEGMTFREGACSGDHDHDHDAQEHGGRDPHVWLSPKLVAIEARNVTKALCEIDPAHAAEYQDNLTAFEAELASLDQRLAKLLLPFRGREFFVFHPAFGYFGDAYGLRQAAVEEDGKEPTGRQLTALIDRARRAGARSIFVQPQFPTSGAKAVAAAIGAEVVYLDPMAEDTVKNLDETGTRLVAGFGPTLTPPGVSAPAGRRIGS